METVKCAECGVGHYQPVKANYVSPFGKQMMVIPDAPAYLCDVCGHKCFNDNFLLSINYLLRQAMKGSPRTTQKRQRAKVMESGEWRVKSGE